jgi:drug/metabolite transporter (DMT)-like permease
MVPVCAIAVGVLAFGEDLPGWKIAASVLIVVGVSVFTLAGRIEKRLRVFVERVPTSG